MTITTIKVESDKQRPQYIKLMYNKHKNTQCVILFEYVNWPSIECVGSTVIHTCSTMQMTGAVNGEMFAINFGSI